MRLWDGLRNLVLKRGLPASLLSGALDLFEGLARDGHAEAAGGKEAQKAEVPFPGIPFRLHGVAVRFSKCGNCAPPGSAEFAGEEFGGAGDLILLQAVAG